MLIGDPSSLQCIRQGDPRSCVLLCPRVAPSIRPTITDWLEKNIAPHDIVLVDMAVSVTPLDPRWHDSTSQIAAKIERIGVQVFGWNRLIPPQHQHTHHQIQTLRGYQAFLERAVHEFPDERLPAFNRQWSMAQTTIDEITHNQPPPIADTTLLSTFFESFESFTQIAHPLGGKVIGIFENRTIPLDIGTEASWTNPTVMCPIEAFDYSITIR